MENLLINDNQDITLTEQEVLEQSQNSVRTIADSLLKTKAYYNALAANAVMHYLQEKGLLHGEIVNMHSCSKMLVDFEIADIQLPNLSIDVRAVFNENEIFIPKKHFEYKLLPDIYLIMKLDDDLANGTLLGYVEPAKINKQNQNDEYYFVNKSILTSPSKLPELINSLPVKQQYVISENAELAVEKLIMLYMDHDIDNLKLEKLIDYLKNSVIAREKLVEFENFERLSYMALKEFKNLDLEDNDFSKYIRTLVATDEFAQFDDKNDDLAELFGEKSPETRGLFVDDTIEEVPESGAVAETPVDEEDLPLTKAEHEASAASVDEEIEADVFDDIEELTLTEDNTDETAAEQSVVGDVLPAEAPEETVAEESSDDSVLDEFDAFEATDEFDIPDELLADSTAEQEIEDVAVEPVETVDAVGLTETVEETSELHDEVVAETAEEENIVTDVSDIPDIAETSEPLDSTGMQDALPEVSEGEETLDIPETVEEEPVSVDELITDEDLEDTSETLTDSFSGEDLELQQVEELEPVAETLEPENIEISEEPIEEISLETPEISEDIITDVSEEKEEPKELDVAQALDLDTVNLDSDTVIGLSEDMIDIKDVENVDTASTTDTEETLSPEILDSIEFPADNEETENAEIPEEKTPEANSTETVETVTDEDIDNAIAQSGAADKKEDEKNSDLALLMSGETLSDADDLSLEELLSMENDLSATEDPHSAFHFDDSDDDDGLNSNPDKTTAASAEELEMLAADLDAEPEAVIKDKTPEIGDTDDEDISDFAFAVDAKPQGNSKKILIPVAALVTVLGLAGAGAWYYLSHGKSGAAVDTIGTGNADIDLNDISPAAVEDSLTTDIQVGGDTAAKPAVPPAKTGNEKASPAKTPAAKTTDAKAADVQLPAEKTDEVAKPEPLTIQKIKKDFSQPNTYLSVSKIVWDVPEYLTYNDDFNSYLQTLGSTLNLNLSSDLLLISENTVFNKVKVKIELKDSGKKYSAELAEGCGAQVVDDLVLQSVKNTLNLLKPPVNSLETADEELFITIYL